MPARVIQGYFIGGILSGSVRSVAPGQARAGGGGPPPPAFARGAAAVQSRPAPGRPPSLNAPARTAQPHGGGGSFEIDPVKIGLARNGGGAPLPGAVLAKMEAAFDADFSSVRVHVGSQASRIGAIAFTMGNDLYFAPGRYQPDTIQGQQLIGHELAHVIQQRQGRVRAPGTGVAIVQDRVLEAEADRLGMRAAASREAVQAKPAQPGPHWVPTSGHQPVSAPFSAQRKPPFALGSWNRIQRMEIDVEAPAPRILGINLHLSHGEALGNTGGVQTTTLEAKINGIVIGKFDNRRSFMAKGKVVTDSTLVGQFPDHICKKYWELGTGAHGNWVPHSEDYLLAALYEEFKRLGGNWSSAYPRANGQNFDLLSIKMDKTCCPNCARNMMKACTAFGLRFREKASTLNTATNSKGLTGAEMLWAGKVKKKLNSNDYLYNMAPIPVRHWTTTQIEEYLTSKSKKVSSLNSGGFLKFGQINQGATNKYPGKESAELGWSNWGYGRKSGGGKW